MPFDSLNDILGSFAHQTLGQKQQEYQRLVECWAIAVGPKIVKHTRLLCVERGILKVATSSAAWAQTLTFERRRILQVLNAHRDSEIADIRFSTRDWVNCSNESPSLAGQLQTMWQEHPSRLFDDNSGGSTSAESSASQDPKAAFKQWAARLKTRSASLPLCSECGSPTPPGELERWSVCAVCATKQW